MTAIHAAVERVVNLYQAELDLTRAGCEAVSSELYASRTQEARRFFRRARAARRLRMALLKRWRLT